MNSPLTANELNFRLTTAVAYRLGHNQQYFTFHSVTKTVLELEDLYTRDELVYMAQVDNVDELHEAISAIL